MRSVSPVEFVRLRGIPAVRYWWRVDWERLLILAEKLVGEGDTYCLPVSREVEEAGC